MAHVVVLGFIVGVTFITIPHPVPAAFKPQIDTKLIDLGDYPLKPAKTQAGGGGGGGDGDVLQASVGRLPKSSMRQITPPAAVIRNPTPKLAVEPTVIVPPDIKLAMNPNMPNLGDPKSSAVIPSNGPGAFGGIGPGSEGGVGPGHGRGVGPGDEAGTGGDTFRIGKGVGQELEIRAGQKGRARCSSGNRRRGRLSFVLTRLQRRRGATRRSPPPLKLAQLRLRKCLWGRSFHQLHKHLVKSCQIRIPLDFLQLCAKFRVVFVRPRQRVSIGRTVVDVHTQIAGFFSGDQGRINP